MTKKAKIIIASVISVVAASWIAIGITTLIRHEQAWKEAQNMIEIWDFQENGEINKTGKPALTFDRRNLDIYAIDRLDSLYSQIKLKFKNGDETRTPSLKGKKEWFVEYMKEKVGFDSVPWWGTS